MCSSKFYRNVYQSEISQKENFRFSWGLIAFTELQALSKLQKKESAAAIRLKYKFLS
jgi:hypothetical protein